MYLYTYVVHNKWIWIIINRQEKAAVRHICTSWIPREHIKGHHCAHMVCNGNSRNCSSEMFKRGKLERMLCSILGGPLFHRHNPNCFLKVVVSYDKFPTSNTLRKIHSFSRKMKSWWSVSTSGHIQHPWVIIWCALHSMMSLWTWNQWHRLRIAHILEVAKSSHMNLNRSYTQRKQDLISCRSWSRGSCITTWWIFTYPYLGGASTSCTGNNLTKVATGMIHEAKII